MADTTIRVNVQTRDRLKVLADESGMTMTDLVARLAHTVPTRAERQRRAAEDLAYVRDHLCPDLTEQDVTDGTRLWEQIAAGHVPASLGDADSASGHGRKAS